MSSIRDGVRRGEPFVDTGVVAEWALSNKTKNRLAHAYYGNGTVEERIEKVEGEIEEVKGEIQKVEKNLLAIDWNETRTPDAHGRLYYKLSEEQLGKKDEQLRKKEEQLRDLLLVEKQQQTSASSGQSAQAVIPEEWSGVGRERGLLAVLGGAVPAKGISGGAGEKRSQKEHWTARNWSGTPGVAVLEAAVLAEGCSGGGRRIGEESSLQDLRRERLEQHLGGRDGCAANLASELQNAHFCDGVRGGEPAEDPGVAACLEERLGRCDGCDARVASELQNAPLCRFRVRGGEPLEKGRDTGVAAEWALSNKTKNRVAHSYYGNSAAPYCKHCGKGPGEPLPCGGNPEGQRMHEYVALPPPPAVPQGLWHVTFTIKHANQVAGLGKFLRDAASRKAALSRHESYPFEFANDGLSSDLVVDFWFDTRPDAHKFCNHVYRRLPDSHRSSV
uniref:Uncharacterized protein n=1 Tax=Chromera velia CCMP2878 TaxID=1169474 RepID=A0A0G4H2F5_9ALVE|eukprot:Cvel_24372.t1-p1 / transcript=Cvel_24372.t1 / gene=Cvel_24372 / organism=Chromera_velia_CCMP2878 / gene_product=hypothetical protein / transcript_product=hypothetical protein / location=Cvel_scaffold2625:7488-11839(-) / protein_length=445 / sequence_SO=supercontig / SO=protein_coding / is_pseudo=false